MTRLVLLSLLAACTVSDGTGPSGGGPMDAQGSGSAGGDGAINPHLDGGTLPDGMMAAFQCRDRKTTGLVDGHHHVGENCQQACHDHGFVASGTLYASATGGTLSGVAVSIVQSDGVIKDMYSASNGNFYWPLTVQYPANIIVSQCPTITPMVMTLTDPDQGACSTNACHGGAAGRVHL